MEANTQAFPLSSLPTEALDEIFSFLKIQDIKTIRGVNKRLNEVTNQSIYCENEIFHWKPIISQHRVVELLNGSKRSVFNLHIDGVHFVDDFVLLFFQKHGSKVHSLSFEDCRMPAQLLEDILLECTALRSFSFITSESFAPLVLFDDFRIFETQSIVLKDVTSFTLVLEQMLPQYMDDATFRRFISIFPNVKRLDIRISISDYVSQDDYSFFSASEWNVSGDAQDSWLLKNASIYEYIIQKSRNLESLRMNFPFEIPSEIKDSFFEALSNLNHLCLDWPYSHEKWTNLPLWLTVLQCIPYLEIRNYSKIVANLLHALRPKHLTTFKETYGRSARISNSFVKLLESTLQIAELIDIFLDGFIPDETAQLPVNTTLTDLNLRKFYEDHSETKALFPAFFRALVHLKLGMVSNNLLQNIFQHQKNLRSLYLGDCQECSLYGFTGSQNEQQLSIRELQNLEHLTMIKFGSSIFKSTQFRDSLAQLSRLKYLYIEANYDRTVSSDKLAVTVFESMKNLEALRLCNLGKASDEELTLLCQNLKNLRYLNLSHSNVPGFEMHFNGVCFVDLSKSTFEDLLVHLEDGQGFYDENLKKIVLVDKSFKTLLFSPTISSFVIDWIVF